MKFRAAADCDSAGAEVSTVPLSQLRSSVAATALMRALSQHLSRRASLEAPMRLPGNDGLRSRST